MDVTAKQTLMSRPGSTSEAARLSIARSKSSERHAVLCDLEAQIAGALSLIGIENRTDDPNGDLLHAAILLQKALEIGEDLRNLILQAEASSRRKSRK